jgi:hypothetical protein
MIEKKDQFISHNEHPKMCCYPKLYRSTFVLQSHTKIKTVCIPSQNWGPCPHCITELCYSKNYGMHSEIIFCSGQSHADGQVHMAKRYTQKWNMSVCCLPGSGKSKSRNTIADGNYSSYCWHAEWYPSTTLLLPLTTSSLTQA